MCWLLKFLKLCVRMMLTHKQTLKGINMAKKKTEEKFTVKDSMIFEKSDRKKAHEEGAAPQKPKKRIKLIATICLSVVILLVAVPWLVVTIIESPNEAIINDGKAKNTYQELVDKTEATEFSDKLLQMKNPDLNDTAKLNELVAFLRPEERLGSYTVSAQSVEKPYTVTLKFNSTHDVPEDGEDKWQNTVIKYSCAILALTDNVAQVNWVYPDANGQPAGSYFTRGDAEKFFNLNVPAIRFADSSQSIQLMLNLLGIDLY